MSYFENVALWVCVHGSSIQVLDFLLAKGAKHIKHWAIGWFWTIPSKYQNFDFPIYVTPKQQIMATNYLNKFKIQI